MTTGAGEGVGDAVAVDFSGKAALAVSADTAAVFSDGISAAGSLVTACLISTDWEMGFSFFAFSFLTASWRTAAGTGGSSAGITTAAPFSAAAFF